MFKTNQTLISVQAGGDLPHTANTFITKPVVNDKYANNDAVILNHPQPGSIL